MNDQLSMIELVLNASFVVQLVMIILVIMSLYSWTIIFSRKHRINSINKYINKFIKTFNHNDDINTVYQNATNTKKPKLIEHIIIAGIDEAKQIGGPNSNNTPQLFDTSAQRAKAKMQVVLERKLEQINQGISTLAMIGSISPYIGLFGTVWGIMHAFIGLAAVKQATIAVVAPGIAEALIATAIGLLVAIPATMAYNSFMTKIETIYQLHEACIEEIYILLQRR